MISSFGHVVRVRDDRRRGRGLTLSTPAHVAVRAITASITPAVSFPLTSAATVPVSITITSTTTITATSRPQPAAILVS